MAISTTKWHGVGKPYAVLRQGRRSFPASEWQLALDQWFAPHFRRLSQRMPFTSRCFLARKHGINPPAKALHLEYGIRKDRIEKEAIVDAYGPEEQALGWYYYLENKIRFPFQAKCIVNEAVSPLPKDETEEVKRLASEHACASDMLVLNRWHGRNLAVPLSQLTPINADASTVEAIGGWHYVASHGYCFRTTSIESSFTQTCRELTAFPLTLGTALIGGAVSALRRESHALFICCRQQLRSKEPGRALFLW
jgi:hypothetical protein